MTQADRSEYDEYLIPNTERWEPDAQLVPSFMAGTRAELKLTAADRSWVVAGLTLAGKTAEDIAERLGRSLRLVRTIRSDPMTQVCMFYQREVEAFEAELRMSRSAHSGAETRLSETQAELDRVRGQLRNLIGRTEFGCGHRMDRYNTYEWTDAKGRKKTACRTCHRQRQADRRSCQSELAQGEGGAFDDAAILVTPGPELARRAILGQPQDPA